MLLVTSNQKIPLIPEFYGSGSAEKAEQINAFVNDLNQKSLVIHEKGRWYSLVLSIPFVLLGAGAIVYGIQELLTFVRSRLKP